MHQHQGTAAPPVWLLSEPPLSPGAERFPLPRITDPESPSTEPRLGPGDRILNGRGWTDPPPSLEVVSAMPEPPPMTATLSVRLANGERVPMGTYASHEHATIEGRLLTHRMGRDGEWLYVNDRYVRPDMVVSVDVELNAA